jgi:uncharacterized repeat protein (TIGR02543 family)
LSKKWKEEDAGLTWKDNDTKKYQDVKGGMVSMNKKRILTLSMALVLFASCIMLGLGLSTPTSQTHEIQTVQAGTYTHSIQNTTGNMTLAFNRNFSPSTHGAPANVVTAVNETTLPAHGGNSNWDISYDNANSSFRMIFFANGVPASQGMASFHLDIWKIQGHHTSWASMQDQPAVRVTHDSFHNNGLFAHARTQPVGAIPTGVWTLIALITTTTTPPALSFPMDIEATSSTGNPFTQTNLRTISPFVAHLDFRFLLPDPPAPTGFYFSGWYFDAGFTQAYDGRVITGNTTLHARFLPFIYSVSFETNNGTFVTQPTNTTYTIESTLSIPTNIQREGHHFRGWYTNPSFTGSPVTSIPQGTVGNTTLYAKWEIMMFNVQFIVNGEIWREIEVEWGTVLSELPNIAAVSGMSRADWFWDEELMEMIAFGAFGNFAITGDLTIYSDGFPPVPPIIWVMSGIAGLFGLVLIANIFSLIFNRKKY